MILIADSGSTKTDWCAVDEGREMCRVATQGINPFHQDERAIRSVLNDELLPQLNGISPDKIYFYGSGCREDQVVKMERLLGRAFPHCSDISACGDLLAAARAVCGDNEGIACIMGTGANSCLYDGKKIVMNTPPLGYILGDEGGGAVLGKMFLNAIFKDRLPVEMRERFLEETQLSLSDIIQKVYREPLANRFLASISLFIRKNLDVESVRRLVVENFRNHFRYNVEQYGRHDLAVGAVGSVAYYYADQLRAAAQTEGYQVGEILLSPMDGLVAYHSR